MTAPKSIAVAVNGATRCFAHKACPQREIAEIADATLSRASVGGSFQYERICEQIDSGQIPADKFPALAAQLNIPSPAGAGVADTGALSAAASTPVQKEGASDDSEDPLYSSNAAARFTPTATVGFSHSAAATSLNTNDELLPASGWNETTDCQTQTNSHTL